MKVRVALAVLVALAAGAGAGFAVASSNEPAPAGPLDPGTAAVVPIPAKPKRPVEQDQPESNVPTLEPGLDYVTQTLEMPGDADTGVPTYQLTLPTPQGWGRGYNGTDRWTYSPDIEVSYAYALRVQIIANQGVSMSTAVRSRTSALESAEAQGNLADLEISLNSSGDGFTATYVKDDNVIVSMERFYPGDDPNQAFATVAAYGRERDRLGLEDLLALVSKDLRTDEVPVDDGDDAGGQ